MKGLIKPHKELNSVRICVEAMTLLSTHADLFRDGLRTSSRDIICRYALLVINSTLEICSTQSNQGIREAASELLAQVASQVASCDDDDEESKRIANDVIEVLTKVWNDESEHSVKIEPTIKAGKLFDALTDLAQSESCPKVSSRSWGRTRSRFTLRDSCLSR